MNVYADDAYRKIVLGVIGAPNKMEVGADGALSKMEIGVDTAWSKKELRARWNLQQVFFSVRWS